MDKAEILKQVNDIFIDILGNQHITLSYETSANDIEEWDSLRHILIVVGIEKKFNIRFASREIQNWSNVGAMIQSISIKIN